MTLPIIPLVDLGPAVSIGWHSICRTRCGCSPPPDAGLLSGPVLALMDRRSRRWLAANETPYRAEIDTVASIPGVAHTA